MAYTTLEKAFYADVSSERHSNHRALYRARFESESTIRTGIQLQNGELFCAFPVELVLEGENIYKNESRIASLWPSLPYVARGAFVRSLILDEVVSSNEIEGVHSTRRQIEVALENAAASGSKHAPFYEFAKLYLGLSSVSPLPKTPADVRAVFDAVVDGSLAEDAKPDGKLFRSEPVHIENNRGKRLHSGVVPESEIIRLVEQMIELNLREDSSSLARAVMGHFLFEYTHPFYDGNGRTGRYLLALYLSRLLSQATVLSLSRTIAENKNAYYKGFDVVERPLNCCEATPFVAMFFDLILRAQEDVIASLEMKKAQLESLDETLLEMQAIYSGRSVEVLRYAAQMHLFEAFGETSLTGLSEYLGVSKATASKAFSELIELGVLRKVSSRPFVCKFSSAGAKQLGLEQDR